MWDSTVSNSSKDRIFLLVDLQDFFPRFSVGGKEKSSENDQLTSFFYIPRTNSKTSKVNRQSVLNL